jgi:quercetin dioxygenase-like cupin family protein
MRTICNIFTAAIAVLVIIGAQISLTAQTSKDEPMLTRFKDVKFEHLPFLPDCLMIYSEHGDPTTGPSHVLSRMTPGCVIPWHWHSPNEYMLVVSGAYENQPRGEAAFIMHSGDYSYLPSHHQHRGMCRGPEPCIGFLYSDAPADVHWIDEKGNEISITDALKAVNASQFAPVKTQ